MVEAQFIGVEKVLSLFESMQPGIIAGIKAEMSRQAIMLLNKVKDGYLEGPRPERLGVGKTGLLKRSITQKVTATDGHYEGIVGTNVKYGGYWEMGFDRKVGAGARGGPKSITSELALAKYYATHQPGVKHYAARPFLVPALKEMEPTIKAALMAAVARVIGKAGGK